MLRQSSDNVTATIYSIADAFKQICFASMLEPVLRNCLQLEIRIFAYFRHAVAYDYEFEPIL